MHWIEELLKKLLVEKYVCEREYRKVLPGDEICLLKRVQKSSSWFLRLNFSKACVAEPSLPISPTRERKWEKKKKKSRLTFKAIVVFVYLGLFQINLFIEHLSSTRWHTVQPDFDNCQAKKQSWWPPLMSRPRRCLVIYFPLLTGEILQLSTFVLPGKMRIYFLSRPQFLKLQNRGTTNPIFWHSLPKASLLQPVVLWTRAGDNHSAILDCRSYLILTGERIKP